MDRGRGRSAALSGVVAHAMTGRRGRCGAGRAPLVGAEDLSRDPGATEAGALRAAHQTDATSPCGAKSGNESGMTA